jgi:DNA polymerase-3 subunit gamma/tau
MTLVLQRMAVHQVDAAAELVDADAREEARLAALLPPDETQLLYSLCLHGRAELGLAPDEYAALTMVLLRLLAFKPAGVEKKSLKSAEPLHTAPAPASIPKAAPAMVAAPVSPPPQPAPAPKFSPQAVAAVDEQDPSGDAWSPEHDSTADDVPPWDALPEAKPVVAVPVREQPFPSSTPAASEALPGAALQPTELGDLWFDTVQALVQAEAVAALNRELALQSQLVARDGDRWHLRTERQTLNQASTRDRLAQALQSLGWSVQLQVDTGVVSDTPALRLAARAAAAQQQAESIIMSDPFVQQMMREFGGKIVPGTLHAAPASS